MENLRLSHHVHPGDEPYLLLVHGFLSSAAQWRGNLEALGRVCRPVTVELWGHGSSPTPSESSYYLPEHYAEQFEQLKKDLGITRWFVCGYSIGAALTARYAHRYPESVVGHVLTNSSSAFADDDQVAQWRANAAETTARIERDGLRAVERIPVHPRFAHRLPKPLYRDLNADADRLNPVAVALTLSHTTPNASIRRIAATNPRPALLCFGREEQRFHPSKQWAEANMRELSIVELDAAHGVNMEDAAGFNDAVCDFIATLSQSTQT